MYPPLLIANLLALAATRHQSLADVAGTIGVDATTLLHYRSGRRRLSMTAFSNILRAYGDDPSISKDALYYARVEYHPPAPDAIEAAAKGLSPAAVSALQRFVDRLPEEAVTTGRGLYLFAREDASLQAATRFLVRSFEKARIPVCHLRYDARLTASYRRDALAAPVLLVERVDWARDTVAALIAERAALVRPIVVTSLKPPEAIADPHLRRTLLAQTRLLDLDPPSHPTHGPVPRTRSARRIALAAGSRA